MSKVTARSKRANTERSVREKNYKIFAVNFHGNSLNSIRDEFLAMANDGSRRNIIVIDLDAELKEYIRKNKPKQGYSSNVVDPLALTTAAIEQRRQYYDFITKTIEIEQKFDLFQYWSKRIPVPEVPTKAAKNVTGKKPLEKLPEKIEKKNPKSAKLPVVKELEPVQLICPKLVQREHNIIGNGEKMAKRKFIEDSPPNTKLFIILLGTNVSKMYMDLLRQGEPLQAIVHFIPELSAYDLLVPIPRSEVFLRRTLHEIKISIDDLRIPKLTKPIGMFQQQLPVISRCLAHKHAEQIYDELSWYFYDLEIIKQQYELYYFQAFHERNVEMDDRVSLQDLLATAESLTIQGHFLSSPLPAAATDLGTIVVFLEGLISTVHMPGDILTDFEIKLLSGQMPTTISATYSDLFNALETEYRNAFKSITKISRFNRLAVERVNDIFCSMVSYMNMNNFTTLYPCCLEYNIMRRYISSTKVLDCVKPKPPEEELEQFFLPQYCKLYATHDGTSQRLYELLTTEYDHYEVNTLPSDFRLYHFKRNYNEIVQTEKSMIVPTRLCFRDFTIFQLETFIKDFISPKPPEDDINALQQNFELKIPSAILNISTNIFIRPLSLKARKLQIPDIPMESKPKELKWKPQQSSSIDKSANKDYIGLPPGHPLLYGYNLEDTLQEVIVKTSTYHFEEGSLKRYEDRWCYDDLNKNINININECSINLFRPRQGQGISRKIQIRTKNDLTCRIYATEDECAQIVLNYPNGLSVYFYEYTCEQQWSIQETFKFEKQRLFIPEGAIIVHYHAEDVIRILRHNGEVYELFQYELGGEEEEGEGFFFGLNTNTTEPQSQFIEKDVVTPKSVTIATPSTKRTVDNTAKIETGKIKQDTIQPKEDYEEENISSLNLNFTKSVKDFLSERYEYELRFINLIATKYDLTYIHMKVTTTAGRIVYLTNTGKIFEAKPCNNVEWHDYFANESYSMRNDGVKLIWTKDALKCFHKNGSIITTKVDESFVQSEYEESEPLHISQSSSHPSEPFLEFNVKPIVLGPLIPDHLFVNVMSRATKTEFDIDQLQKEYASKYESIDDMISYLPMEEEEEHKAELEKPPEEKRFIYCQNSNFMMQHAKYAAVNFVTLRSCTGKIRIYMYILAADDVRVEIVAVDLEKSTQDEENVDEEEEEKEEEEEEESEQCNDTVRNKRIKAHEEPVLPECSYIEMEEGEEEAREHILKKMLKFNISDDVELKVDEESCQISAVVERNDSVCGKVCDILSLGFQFDDDIDDLYKEFVRIISEFKKYTEPTFKELYFIDKETSSCEMQGFEFYKTLPVLGEYSLVASNVITDMSSLNSIADKMTNKYDWYEKDMKKFPRLRARERKEQYPSIPRVQSVNTFCKIPRRLQSTDEINKFLEPFDTVNFKRMRRHIRLAMEYHLRPDLRFKLFKRCSKMSWRRRHMIHRRRLFIEMQRKGLYHAMLKHKVYPKYFEFMDHFFGHVKNIDFFEYVTYQCMPKEAEKPEIKGKA